MLILHKLELLAKRFQILFGNTKKVKEKTIGQEASNKISIASMELLSLDKSIHTRLMIPALQEMVCTTNTSKVQSTS